MVNIEIKAKCSEHDRIRNILKSLEAVFKGTDHQTDTYFKVNNGRLKLREGNIENHLIYYERQNTSSPKQSNFILYKSNNPALLKEILTKSYGILTIVDKQREIYYIGNVKFHIDNVKNLGEFMEIEAADSGGTIEKDELQEQCTYYMRIFNLNVTDLISVSYSDLLLNKPYPH